jgi:hypothetical protein
MAFSALLAGISVSSLPSAGVIVIRQAISCDICGTEKRQTNHWFVAYEQSGELRVSQWTSRRRGRAGSKHLCGQTCLHKLVDEFMASSIATRTRPAIDEGEAEPAVPVPVATDASLTSAAAHAEVESSARMVTPAVRAMPRRASSPPPDVVTMPSRLEQESLSPAADEAPRHASSIWRTQAWQRERERESRSPKNRSAGADRDHAVSERRG